MSINGIPNPADMTMMIIKERVSSGGLPYPIEMVLKKEGKQRQVTKVVHKVVVLC